MLALHSPFKYVAVLNLRNRRLEEDARTFFFCMEVHIGTLGLSRGFSNFDLEAVIWAHLWFTRGLKRAKCVSL